MGQFYFDTIKYGGPAELRDLQAVKDRLKGRPYQSPPYRRLDKAPWAALDLLTKWTQRFNFRCGGTAYPG